MQVGTAGSVTSPVLDFGGHGHESLLDVCSIFGGGFQERNANLVSKRLQGTKETRKTW